MRDLRRVVDQGVDAWEAIELANHHPRVNILQPGPGVGGHCIAVDPWFIVDSAPNSTPLIQAARGVNDGKPGRIVEAVKVMTNEMNNPTIACLGLAYKADIDDLRESPAVQITQTIASQTEGTVLVVEPHVQSLPNKLAEMRNIQLTDLQRAYNDADVIILLTDHSQFCDLPPAPRADQKVIDTRGAWRKT